MNQEITGNSHCHLFCLFFLMSIILLDERQIPQHKSQTGIQAQDLIFAPATPVRRQPDHAKHPTMRPMDTPQTPYRESTAEIPDSEPKRAAKRKMSSFDLSRSSSPTPVPAEPPLPALFTPRQQPLTKTPSFATKDSFIFGSARLMNHNRPRIIPRQGLVTSTERADLSVNDWLFDFEKRLAEVQQAGALLNDVLSVIQAQNSMGIIQGIQEAVLKVIRALSRLEAWSEHTPIRWKLDDYYEITWEWRQIDHRRMQLQQLLVDNNIPIPPPYPDEANGPAQVDKTSYEDPTTLEELREMWEEDEENRMLWEKSNSRRMENTMQDYL